MASTGIASKTLLFPYWLTLAIRNKLYDKGVLKSESFDIPVISVGNISVGGTGKTPHTEMLVSLLSGKYRIAVISRGYKRKSKGYHEVKATDDFSLCGDEPLQIKRKFPQIIVAVCKDRALAIRKVTEEYGVNLIILDDAFQYRKIKPSCNILLVNYNRTIAGDNLLPIGRLRDLASQVKRADAVIITKCPDFGEFDGNQDEAKGLEAIAEQEKKWRKNLGSAMTSLFSSQLQSFARLFLFSRGSAMCATFIQSLRRLLLASPMTGSSAPSWWPRIRWRRCSSFPTTRISRAQT